jgi:hypothetical protein
VSALSALGVEAFLDMVMIRRGLMLSGVLLRGDCRRLLLGAWLVWGIGEWRGRRMVSREKKMVSRKEKG